MPHDPEDVLYDWQHEVLAVYREVVAAADPETGVRRQDAYATASERLLDMEARGELKIPPHEAIRAALRQADSADGARADAVLKVALEGQDAFGLEGDPILDVVVVLGDGLRKPWRYVTRDDLMEMDRVRYRNVKSVNNAYDDWRTRFEPTLAALVRHTTFGEAVAAGAFTAS